jgi:uncharacterized membrane protein YgcG
MPKIIMILRRHCPNCKGWKLERKVELLVAVTKERKGMKQVTHHCSDCSYHLQYNEIYSSDGGEGGGGGGGGGDGGGG